VRDERALEVLADRTVENLRRASQKAEPEREGHVADTVLPEIPVLEQQRIPEETKGIVPDTNATAAAESAEAAFHAATEANFEVRPGPLIRTGSRPSDLVVRSLVVAVVAAAVLLGIALGRHVAFSRGARNQRVAVSPLPSDVDSRRAKEATVSSISQKMDSTKSSPASSAAENSGRKRTEPAPGALMIFENGKEVFRSVPAPSSTPRENRKRTVQLASEVAPESGSTIGRPDAQREVLHRVTPEYPQAARDQRIEGQVVLDVHIGADGAVQGIEVISGAPLLAEASTRAVQQWKFKPSLVNGHPLEMQTTITLNFKLE
jgi:TonB family protein